MTEAYSLSLVPIKSTSTSLRLVQFFLLSLLFYRLSSIFFTDSLIYKTIAIQFQFSNWIPIQSVFYRFISSESLRSKLQSEEAASV